MNDEFEIDFSSAKTLPELLDLLRINHVPENRYWKYVGKYQERKAWENGIPFSGQFELTPLCNLDCKMCYVHLNKDQLNGMKILPVDWWEEIMLQAHSSGMMNATMTGGECLIYPGFDELYMFLRGLGVKTTIKSNGLLLNKDRIAYFKKYPPRSIVISLYGSSNEAYKKVTGHAVFDTIYSNLQELKKSDIPVRISITPSKYMNEDVIPIRELAEQLDIPCTVNLLLFPPRKETGRELCDLSLEEYAEIFSNIKEDVTPLPPDEPELPEYSKSGTPSFGIRCSAGRNYFSVSWNGLLSGCDNLNALRVNLLDTPFSTAWKLIHEDALSYPLPQECSKCAYDKVCFNCAAYRNIGMEKGHCNPIICERTKLFVKKGIYKL